MEKQKLPLHEWLAVLTIILALLLLIVVTTFQGSGTLPETTGEPHYLVAQEVEVTVEGAVENPGTYILKKGAQVKDVLELAKPVPQADLRKINPEVKLRDGRILKVPLMPMIRVTLEGAVSQSGTIQVRKGTRLQELAEMPLFRDDADLSSLDKKRKLKDGEIVRVPVKSVVSSQ